MSSIIGKHGFPNICRIMLTRRFAFLFAAAFLLSSFAQPEVPPANPGSIFLSIRMEKTHGTHSTNHAEKSWQGRSWQERRECLRVRPDRPNRQTTLLKFLATCLKDHPIFRAPISRCFSGV
jgi:hypothetical protein